MKKSQLIDMIKNLGPDSEILFFDCYGNLNGEADLEYIKDDDEYYINA